MYVDEFNISAAGQFFGVETTENEKNIPDKDWKKK